MTDKTYGTMYYVDDMAKAVSYYKKLGLKPGYESPDWTDFDLSGHKLCLHSKKKGESYAPNGVLILAKEGVKALYEKLKAEGLHVFGLHEVHPAAWTFHFEDVSGNELSVYGTP